MPTETITVLQELLGLAFIPVIVVLGFIYWIGFISMLRWVWFNWSFSEDQVPWESRTDYLMVRLDLFKGLFALIVSLLWPLSLFVKLVAPLVDVVGEYF